MIKAIESSDNQWIKLAVSLHQKKYRDQTGLFLLEGIHLVQECLKTDWCMEALMFAAGSSSMEMDSVIQMAEQAGVCIYELKETVFKRVAETDTPQGIIAVVRQKRNFLSVDKSDLLSVWVALDQVRDPGNVGTIIRSAEAAGISGIILSEGCADIFAGKTVRASMGAILHLPCFHGASSDILQFCRDQELKLFIADGSGSVCYSQADLTRKCMVVFGNEGVGVSRQYVMAADERISIPILGKAESLNVASAAAVIMFESARQRAFAL